jgi:hypothetical protein
LLVPQQIAETHSRPVQPRLQRTLLDPRDLVDMSQTVPLDVVQREQRTLLPVEPNPSAVEIARVECPLG